MSRIVPNDSIGLSHVLKSASLKVTAPRLVLLEILQRDHGPFTLEEIRNRIKGRKCDLVTVYRALSTFEEAGIVRRCDFGDGTIRYEFQGEEHHHHVICKKCRCVQHLDFCLVEEIEKNLRKQGYRDLSHSLEFFGVCPDCQS